jgi:hypothetical protein
MKLTNQQILALSEAITHLDGLHLTQLIEGKAVAIFRSYHVDAAARWLLARAQGKLQAAIADFNRAKDANHHSGGAGGLGPANPNFKQFSEDFDRLKQQPVELELEGIALADLRLQLNEKAGSELPIAVLNALTPLIKETTTNPAKSHA